MFSGLRVVPPKAGDYASPGRRRDEALFCPKINPFQLGGGPRESLWSLFRIDGLGFEHLLWTPSGGAQNAVILGLGFSTFLQRLTGEALRAKSRT